jgi:serine/threonine-protein kinase RsbW
VRGCLQATIKDQGAGFDPASVPDPTRPENITRPCGRGLFLMRELLDEVSYNDRGNEVTLVLRLESGGALEGGVQA